jgi:hypothetical protein
MATNGTASLYDDDILHPRDLMNDTNYGYDNFTFSGKQFYSRNSFVIFKARENGEKQRIYLFIFIFHNILTRLSA